MKLRRQLYLLTEYVEDLSKPLWYHLAASIHLVVCVQAELLCIDLEHRPAAVGNERTNMPCPSFPLIPTNSHPLCFVREPCVSQISSSVSCIRLSLASVPSDSSPHPNRARTPAPCPAVLPVLQRPISPSSWSLESGIGIHAPRLFFTSTLVGFATQ